MGAIEIGSRLGETCRLRNPWSKPCRVAEFGGTIRELSGDILVFDTRREGRYHLTPADQPAVTHANIRLPAEAPPASLPLDFVQRASCARTAGPRQVTLQQLAPTTAVIAK